MKNQRLHRVFEGAMILSLSSLIAKILGAVYRVPFQNLVGDQGFYVYQQVYPIYGIGMTIALTGLPVFISKLIAEQPDEAGKRRVAQQLLKLITPVSWLILVGLWLLATPLATLMGDRQLAPIIQSVSLMFLFIPLTSVTRGYQQGRYIMTTTSISQLVEQIVRVVIVISVAVISVNVGWNVYQMGTWAMGAAAAAGLSASIVLMPTFKKMLTGTKQAGSINELKIIARRLLLEGGLICLFASLVVLLQLIDSFTVQQALVAKGETPAMAKSLKGIFDRGQPLIQLGLVVATSVSASLLPSLTTSFIEKKEVEFRRIYRSLMHLCTTLACLATAGLVALMPEIDTLLFENTNGQIALSINMISIIFISLITTYSSVLQSINRFRSTVAALLAGIGVKIVINFFLVTKLGIAGASFGTVISLSVALLIIWMKMPSELHAVIEGKTFGMKLAIIVMAMMAVAWIVAALSEMIFGHSRLAMIPNVFLPIIAGVIVSAIGIIRLKLFTVKEVLVFPGGRKILNLLTHSQKTEE